MQGAKYLSEAVHADEIKARTLNLVCSQTGSGKSFWAINHLAKTVTHPYKMVYLIDTINGKEQLLKHPKTQYYTKEWREIVQNKVVWFGEAFQGNKIVVMTYAKFGVLAEHYSNFGFDFELILCDEIHNLPRFCHFTSNEEDTPYHKIAKERLEKIIKESDIKVIGLSATPQRAAEEMNCPTQYITVDEDVRQFETKEIIPYTNLEQALSFVSPDQVGIVYIGHITRMKQFLDLASNKGFRAIAIWSIRNKDHPMTKEQEDAREYILTNSALPPPYDLFIINASSETSINIFSKVDYIVIHTQEKEAQTQVRGRFRGDLDKLFVLDYSASLIVPSEFMGKKLFKEDKDKLCSILNLRDEQYRIHKWSKVKERLINSDYIITDGRIENKRFSIITK